METPSSLSISMTDISEWSICVGHLIDLSSQNTVRFTGLGKFPFWLKTFLIVLTIAPIFFYWLCGHFELYDWEVNLLSFLSWRWLKFNQVESWYSLKFYLISQSSRDGVQRKTNCFAFLFVIRESLQNHLGQTLVTMYLPWWKAWLKLVRIVEIVGVLRTL